jgi:predicted nuclease with TOPRIM domain
MGDSPTDIDKLMQLMVDAVRRRVEALDLENEALKMRLNEARVKLELARDRLEKLGGDVSELNVTTELS